MIDLNFAKLSPLMTAKERAKLVIQIQQKAMKEAKNGDLPEGLRAEMSAIVAACPSHQAKEYNSYINVKDEVWTKIVPMMEVTMLELENAQLRISTIMYLIATSPMMNQMTDYLDRMPVLVKKEDYDKGLEKAKQLIRSEVIQLDGRHGLAEQEAFYRLVAEKYVTEYDLLDEWYWWMDRYGKSKEQLLSENINDKKKGVEHYLKQKKRLGDEKEPFIWKDYAKYENMTDEELAKFIEEKQPEALVFPDKEEYDKWLKTVEEEKARIQKAVTDGKLKWIKGQVKRYKRKERKFHTEEVEGIEAGSYYAWPERYQKYAGEEGSSMKGYNPLSDDCVELRFVKDKDVVFAGDHSIIDKRDHPIAILPPHDNFGSIFHSFKNQRDLVKLSKILSPIKVVKKDYDSEIAIIKFRDIMYRVVIVNFVERAKEHIQYLKDRILLIEQIEQKYFDGMELLPRDLESPLSIIPKVNMSIDKLIADHNHSFDTLIENYTETGRGFWDYDFYKLDELLLPTDIKANEEWVENDMSDMERRI